MVHIDSKIYFYSSSCALPVPGSDGAICHACLSDASLMKVVLLIVFPCNANYMAYMNGLIDSVKTLNSDTFHFKLMPVISLKMNVQISHKN